MPAAKGTLPGSRQLLSVKVRTQISIFPVPTWRIFSAATIELCTPWASDPPLGPSLYTLCSSWAASHRPHFLESLQDTASSVPLTLSLPWRQLLWLLLLHDQPLLFQFPPGPQ